MNLNRSGSYIDCTDWIKSKKTIINPINNDDEFFQYTVTETLKIQ